MNMFIDPHTTSGYHIINNETYPINNMKILRYILLLSIPSIVVISCGVSNRRVLKSNAYYCSRYYRNAYKEFAYPIELAYRPDTCSVCGAKVIETSPSPIYFYAGYFESRKIVAINGQFVSIPNMACVSCGQRYLTPRVKKYEAVRTDSIGTKSLISFAYNKELSPNHSLGKYVSQRTFYLVRNGGLLGRDNLNDTTSTLIRDTPFNPLFPIENVPSFIDGDWDINTNTYSNQIHLVELSLPKELTWTVNISEDPDILLSVLTDNDGFCIYLDVDTFKDYGEDVLQMESFFKSQEYVDYLKRHINDDIIRLKNYACSEEEIGSKKAIRKDVIVNHDFAGIGNIDVYYIIYELVANHKLYSMVFRIPLESYKSDSAEWESRIAQITSGFHLLTKPQ